MVANPASYAGKPDPAPGANEAVLTIGWGAVGRIDLEPAGCGDPECDADHGYTGVLTSDDFSLRVSAAAEGPEAVGEPARLRRRALRPHRQRRRRPMTTPFVAPAYGDRSLARRAARGRPCARRRRRASRRRRSSCPRPGSYVVFLVDGLGYELLRDHPEDAPFLHAPPRHAGHRRRALDHGDQPDLLRHRAAARAATAWSASPAGSRAPTTCSTRSLELQGRPARVAAAPHRVRPAGRRGRAHHRGQQARVRGLRADRRRLPRRRLRRRRPGRGAARRGAGRRRPPARR